MLEYLPPYYETSRVIRALMEAEGLELDKLRQALDETLNQFFVNTATFGLNKWEEELGVSTEYKDNIVSFCWKEMLLWDGTLDESKFNVFLSYLNQFQNVYVKEINDGTPEGDLVFDFIIVLSQSEAERRDRIISKLRGYGTATIYVVKKVAESYDKGSVNIVEDFPVYTITVQFVDTIGVPPVIEHFKAAVRAIVPAHLDILYEYKYFIWNKWDSKNETWNTFDSFLFTWNQLEERE